LYLKWSFLVIALVPVDVDTVTSTVPRFPGGEVALIELAELTVTSVAVLAPNLTVAGARK
jgi:hypothetical protein